MPLNELRALLCDLDGVLYVDDAALPGAIEAVATLRELGLGLRFCTNTTTRTREEVAGRIAALGFDITAAEILTAPRAAASYLRRSGLTACRLVLREAVKQEFAGLEAAAGTSPEAVVLGDIGDRWNHALLEEIFGQLMDGAELVALHRGRYWQAEGRLALDIGLYVAGLEHATGRQATVCGKPAPSFFQAALDELGVTAAQAAMVGDDIESDVGGGQASGLGGVLVRTGKYRAQHAARSAVRPDLVVADIAELAARLAGKPHP